MKSKIAKLLVVFCLILPCVFGLVACDKNVASDKNKGQVQISYVLNGGTNDSENPTIIETAGETIIKPATKEGGYMFVGWYMDEALTQPLETRKLVLTKEDLKNKKTITLYAKWSDEPVFEINGTEITGLTEYGEGFKEIVIPSGVVTIGKRAFYGRQITSIEFSTSVTTIGQEAFRSCGKLTSLEFPASVTTIGTWAFANCEKLESVTFADGCQRPDVGESAFRSIAALKKIVIINSGSISNNIVYSDFFSELIYKVDILYIKTGLPVENSKALSEFTKQTESDKAGYDKYTNNRFTS